MTVGEAQQQGITALRAASIDSARLDTDLLLEHVSGQPRAWLMAHADAKLTTTQSDAFAALITQRASRTPLVHLTNTREFYGLDLYINEHVLTPRVETEKMVDYAVTYAPQGSRLIDIGTGSGAIAIAVKKHRPDLQVWASDISETQLAVARRNAATHGADITFVEASLFDSITDTFATVVTNLPYLRNDADLMPEVTKEPAVALFGGSDGLDLYRSFLQQLPDRLELQGYLFTECDPWQHADLIAEASTHNLMPIESDDYFILGFQRIN